MTKTLKKGDAALYRGKKYLVQFAGQTRFGARAKLSWFSDESRTFWVDLSKVKPVVSTVVKGKTKVVAHVPTFSMRQDDDEPNGWGLSYQDAAAQAEAEEIQAAEAEMARLEMEDALYERECRGWSRLVGERDYFGD
jgi:hypothetical protein